MTFTPSCRQHRATLSVCVQENTRYDQGVMHDSERAVCGGDT